MQLWLPDAGDSARFLQTLTENAVPKWSEHYVDYGKLKKQVKKIAVRFVDPLTLCELHPICFSPSDCMRSAR
jgi:hypothetical protein